MIIFKLNNGQGAYLCSKCHKILYTGNNVPDYLLRMTDKEMRHSELICPDCMKK